VSVQGIELQYMVGGVEEPQAMERLVAAFERGGQELRDFGTFLWPKLTPMLERHIAAQLDGQGTGSTGSFAPLSAKYAAWKSAHYPGAPILQATRAMYEGLTDEASPFAFRQSSGDSYDFGTRGVTYSSFHQSGTARMPARQPLDFGQDVETEMSHIAAQAAREALQRARIDEFVDLSGLHE